MKNTLTTALCLLMFGLASAQTDSIIVDYPTKGASEFGLGFNYNGTYATDNGFTSADGFSTGDAYSFSVQYEYFLSSSWGIKTKLNFDVKAVEAEFPQVIEDQINLYYLTLPLMANWHFGKRKRWYLHFGPYIGYMIRAELDSNGDTSIRTLFNTIEYGSDLGIGVRIKAGDDMWFFIESDTQSSFSAPFRNTALFDEKLVRSTLGFGIIF